jgi:hypothetical protein
MIEISRNTKNSLSEPRHPTAAALTPGESVKGHVTYFNDNQDVIYENVSPTRTIGADVCIGRSSAIDSWNPPIYNQATNDNERIEVLAGKGSDLRFTFDYLFALPPVRQENIEVFNRHIETNLPLPLELPVSKYDEEIVCRSVVPLLPAETPIVHSVVETSSPKVVFCGNLKKEDHGLLPMKQSTNSEGIEVLAGNGCCSRAIKDVALVNLQPQSLDRQEINAELCDELDTDCANEEELNEYCEPIRSIRWPPVHGPDRLQEVEELIDEPMYHHEMDFFVRLPEKQELPLGSSYGQDDLELVIRHTCPQEEEKLIVGQRCLQEEEDLIGGPYLLQEENELMSVPNCLHEEELVDGLKYTYANLKIVVNSDCHKEEEKSLVRQEVLCILYPFDPGIIKGRMTL